MKETSKKWTFQRKINKKSMKWRKILYLGWDNRNWSGCWPCSRPSRKCNRRKEHRWLRKSRRLLDSSSFWKWFENFGKFTSITLLDLVFNAEFGIVAIQRTESIVQADLEILFSKILLFPIAWMLYSFDFKKNRKNSRFSLKNYED